MTAAGRLFRKCGAILFIVAVLTCQLPFSLASADWSDAEEPEAQTPSRDSVQTVLLQLAAPDEESSSERSHRISVEESHESSLESIPLSAALADPTSTSPQNVALVSGQSDEPSSLAHNANDASDAATPEEHPSVGSFSRRARAPSSRQGHLSTTRRLMALFVTLFFTALAGAIVYNFKPLAEMMARDGAYAELCPPNSPPSNITGSVQSLTVDTLSNRSSTTNGTLQSARPLYTCTAQEARVEGLYTVAFAVTCVAGVLAGPLIDSVGSRFTSFIGRTVEIIGLLLLSFRQYGSGFAMLGAGQDVAFLASLSLARMFPRMRGPVLGLLGSLGSVSTVVPYLLRLIVSRTRLTLQQVMLGYAGLVSLPALLAGVALLPSGQRSAPADDTAEPPIAQGEPGERVGTTAGENGPLPPLTAVTAGPTEGILRCAEEIAPRSQPTGLLRTVLRRVLYFIANPELRASFFSVPTLAVTLNFTIACITTNYFLQGAERIFHGPARNQVALFCPVTALPCAILGLLPDRFGASVASLILAGAGLIMTSASFISHNAAGYISLTSLVVYVSALTTQVHWISQELYPLQCRGTISGLILAVGGGLSLFANLLYSTVTLEMSAGDTTFVRAGLGVLQLLQFLLIYIVYRNVQRLHGREDRVRRMLRRLLRRRRRTLPEDRQGRELPE